MVGIYIRTEEIRNKQRNKMKEKIKEYDFAEIDKKRKETLRKSGKKLGRPPGFTKPKTGFDKKCKCCDNTFYVTNHNKENRIYCSKSCLHNDPDYREKQRKIDRSYLKAVYNRGSKLEDSFKIYKNKVYRLTEKTYVEYKHIINPNNYPRTLCGIEGGYQLDHIKSIKKCYNEGLTPEQASVNENLQLIPWKDNLEKRTFEQIMRKN